MFRNYQELRTAAKGRGPVRVAVAAAQDREVMEAVQAGIRTGPVSYTHLLKELGVVRHFTKSELDIADYQGLCRLGGHGG